MLLAAAAGILIGKLGTPSLGARNSSSPDPMAELPRIILWAWERPENLTFINTREVGVAFLAKTIFLKEERVLVRPRLQPLSVTSDATLIAVVRIESTRDRAPALSSDQRAKVVSAIVETARARPVAAIQIDFDARNSERAFYRELLVDLKRELPASTKLSITALASWCIGDNWSDDLPIGAAVPMLFRMGADRRYISEFLKSGRDFNARLSRHSLGISTDEPLTGLPSGRRVYVFNPRSWTEEDVYRIVEEVKQWQLKE